MEKGIYEGIKQRAIDISRHNGACKGGYHDLLKADGIGNLCLVLKKYWSDVVGMHKNDAFGFFDDLYPKHREDFNRYGIFYNESSDRGFCLVNRGADLIFGGNAQVWLFGQSEAKILGHARCIVRDQSIVTAMNGAHVQLFDESSATILGYCYVHGNNNNIVECKAHAKIIGCKIMNSK